MRKVDGDGEVRKCNRCHALKPLTDFPWHRKERGQRNHHCKECMRAYGKAHYRANREHYIREEARRKKARTAERMRFLVDYFRTHPCTDCGEPDPLVLEFDHLGNKSFNISQGFSSRNWQAILDEMEKCDAVCANCHRRRTARRSEHARWFAAALG